MLYIDELHRMVPERQFLDRILKRTSRPNFYVRQTYPRTTSWYIVRTKCVVVKSPSPCPYSTTTNRSPSSWDKSSAASVDILGVIHVVDYFCTNTSIFIVIGIIEDARWIVSQVSRLPPVWLVVLLFVKMITGLLKNYRIFIHVILLLVIKLHILCLIKRYLLQLSFSFCQLSNNHQFLRLTFWSQ